MYHGSADVVTPALLAAFAGFLILAVILYGSFSMAVGAACNDLKDAQSLMWPVMLPVFTRSAVLKDPTSPLAVGMSMFPPGTPFLMLMRMATQPSCPAWQAAVSVLAGDRDRPRRDGHVGPEGVRPAAF